MSSSSTETPGASVPASGAERRVDWFELFFDLAFVAFITQLAQGLHGAPSAHDFEVFIAWSVPAWWAWSNVMVTVNLVPTLPPRMLSVTLLVAMACVGVMAASVTEDASRTWAFSLACAGLRLVLLVLWVYRTRRGGFARWRTFLYNGGTAAVWVAAAWTRGWWTFGLWTLAILVEVVLLRVGRASRSPAPQVDTGHASERLGLFMVILMGESVLSVVSGLEHHWTRGSAVAALTGFVAVCALASGFFVFGIASMEQGLARLNETSNLTGLLDTVMFLPYLLVVAVTMFAAGLSSALAAPGSMLSGGAALCLGGGVALFYLTNVLVSLRWGGTWQDLRRWAIPGVVPPLVVVALSAHLTAAASLALITGLVLLIVLNGAVALRTDDAHDASTSR